MKTILRKIVRPTIQSHWYADLTFALMRFVCGMLLAIDFGASKFGMPWSPEENDLSLFHVAAWFPEDVAAFGGLFKLAPTLFAWLGAFSEAVGGLLLAFGLQTRVAAFLIICTMLVAIIFQQSSSGTWAMLVPAGFLWVAVYHLYFGSGRFGLDNLLSK